jgi:hypothetical protein
MAPRDLLRFDVAHGLNRSEEGRESSGAAAANKTRETNGSRKKHRPFPPWHGIILPRPVVSVAEATDRELPLPPSADNLISTPRAEPHEEALDLTATATY